MRWFFQSNSIWARALRTAVQGALSVLITWASAGFDWDWRYLLAAMVPAVISPIMAAFGGEQSLKGE